MSEPVCEKCYGAMMGPKYCAGLAWCCHRFGDTVSAHPDHLVYTCAVCGYQRIKPTNDALWPPGPPVEQP